VHCVTQGTIRTWRCNAPRMQKRIHLTFQAQSMCIVLDSSTTFLYLAILPQKESSCTETKFSLSKLSNGCQAPFASMAIIGAFRDYICDRMSREGKVMSQQSTRTCRSNWRRMARRIENHVKCIFIVKIQRVIKCRKTCLFAFCEF
jgi:hypothetical protein